MNNQITVLVEGCTMQINLDAFFAHATLIEQKKLFGYVFQEPWRNEKTISTLGEYLSHRLTNAKEAWDTASRQYQNEYICTQYRYDLTAKQKRTVEAANRKLLNAVKGCKIKYDRWNKIIAHFEMLKTKNLIYKGV